MAFLMFLKINNPKTAHLEDLVLVAAIERFYDSLPDKWREIVADNIDCASYVDRKYEAHVLMENGMEIKIEIFYVEEDKDEEWIYKAYKVLL
ncbi:hypothetical protein P4V72_13875 [Bacillus thuringiensis]|nr:MULTISPECIES: hypothetical protein [Bacillus cereus group]MCU4981946.1 hypothetical protein [Bacillus cereus]MCU5138614.1 hypothetical protein [Bacillus cereus]MCU5345852.1 hypothetical protein [Bacillus cereus]MDO6634053.1 hypothetical protein [Bacillus thuringiensis]MDO6704215.1 hypothetical protein [Bacillus thuringiensis]